MHAGFAQCGDRLMQIALQNTAMPGNFHRGTAVQSGNMGCQRSQQPREQPRFAGFDLRATSQALRSDTLDMQRRTVRRNPAAHTPDDLDGSDYIVARGVIGEPALSRSQRSSQHGPLSHALGTRNGNRRPTELAKSLERIIFGRKQPLHLLAGILPRRRGVGCSS